jgi:AraC-like DNA-binding protein
MLLLDQLARGCTIAILAVLGVLLGRERRRIPSARIGVAFFLTIAAHLVLTSPHYAGWDGLDLILGTAALAAPGAFFLFSRALFDDEGGLTPRDAWILAILIATGWMRSSPVADIATVLYYAGSLAVVLFALGRVVRGFPTDLVEPRRRLRAAFTALVGLQILVVIAAEILLPVDRRTQALETMKSTGALLLTALFAIWFLTPRRELFAADPVINVTTIMMPPIAMPTVTVGAEEDSRFRERLLSLMQDERVYRQEGLTIALLARKLDIPEYRLRRIINQQLGYRNFTAFLNDFRIEEACGILADPAQERLPILNLALDLGYGSSGPFNRAFRARTGQTPTEYRRGHGPQR